MLQIASVMLLATSPGKALEANMPCRSAHPAPVGPEQRAELHWCKETSSKKSICARKLLRVFIFSAVGYFLLADETSIPGDAKAVETERCSEVPSLAQPECELVVWNLCAPWLSPCLHTAQAPQRGYQLTRQTGHHTMWLRAQQTPFNRDTQQGAQWEMQHATSAP